MVGINGQQMPPDEIQAALARVHATNRSFTVIFRIGDAESREEIEERRLRELQAGQAERMRHEHEAEQAELEQHRRELEELARMRAEVEEVERRRRDALEAERRRLEAEAADVRRREAEEADRRRREEEAAEQLRREEEEAERKRQDTELERQRIEFEEIERGREEEERRFMEYMEQEQRQWEAAEAGRRRKEAEEAERRASTREALERQHMQVEDEQARQWEAELRRREEEEADRRRREEEERRLKEAFDRRLRDAEEKARLRREEETAKRKLLAQQEAERIRREAEEAAELQAELDRRQREEEANCKRRQEEEDRQRRQQLEEQRRIQEQAAVEEEQRRLRELAEAEERCRRQEAEAEERIRLEAAAEAERLRIRAQKEARQQQQEQNQIRELERIQANNEAARQVVENQLQAATGLPPRGRVQEPQKALMAALTNPTARAFRPRGPCDKCDGPHDDAECPHFKKGRTQHKDAWEYYGQGGAGNDSASRLVVRSAKVVPQPGDGSCLFHSLAYGLRGTNAPRLRAEIADFIAANPGTCIAANPISDWVLWDSGLDPQAYSRTMRSGSRWGGAVELAVCAKLKGVRVDVYEQRRRGSGFERISSFNSEAGDTQVVSLLYGGRVHYDALQI